MRRSLRPGSCGVAMLAVACFFLPRAQADSVSVYFNEAQWQAAMSAQGSNQLSSVSFADSQWSSSMQLSPNYTSLVSQSSTAASNGMSIQVVSGYGAPGVADNSTLGHVVDDEWTDVLSKYGSTTFNFSQGIYGFGGDFDIAQANGLFITPAGDVPAADGFIGIVSSQAMNSFLITWGDNGNCSGCFGNSYTLSDFTVAAAMPTPEPNFGYVFLVLLIIGAGYAGSRLS